MNIFIDMDDVLVDFIGGVKKFCNFDGKICGLQDRWMEQIMGADGTDIFWKTTGRSNDFWINLQPTPHYLKVLDICESMGPVGLLSCGSCIPEIYSAKMKWVDRWLPRFRRKLFVGSDKFLLAHKDAVLVDDLERNIRAWREAGGYGILFPCESNSEYMLDPLHSLKSRFGKIKKGAVNANLSSCVK